MDNKELNKLEALANKLGGEQWTDDSEGYGVVFGADGDSVCVCHANAGAMPEFIYESDRSAYIAAANPAAILELIALARAGSEAPAALGSAFITLESGGGGEGRTIVMKFNRRDDAYAVHDFLLSSGGRDYSAAPTCQPPEVICQPEGCQVSAAPAAPTAELIANVILSLIGECVMDWKAGLNSDDPEEDAFHSDAEELRVLVDLVNKALAAPTAAQDEWISVDDERKPKGRTPILVTVDYVRYGEYEDGTPGEWRGQIVTEGEYVPQHGELGDYFTSYSSPHGDGEAVTHWMPIPTPAQPKDTTDTTKGQA